ncbi:MAG: DUF3971 domain-containing protein [Rickettsiaceae bacterium]|nr:DUF3971 domain-containing protein [Rickettsiaceae bacterium]
MTFLLKTLKFFFYILLLAIICAGSFLIPAVRNFVAKAMIYHYAETNGVKFSCSKIVSSTKKIKFKDVVLSFAGADLKAEKVHIQYNLIDLISKSEGLFKITSDKLLLNEDALLKFETNIHYNHFSGRALIEPKIYSIKIPENKANINSISMIGTMLYHDNFLEIDKLNLDIDKGFVRVVSKKISNKPKDQEVTLDMELGKLPIKIYDILLSKSSKIRDYLDYSLESGFLESCSIHVSAKDQDISITDALLDPKKLKTLVSKANVQGEMLVSDITYKYYDQMPKVTAKSLPILIKDSVLLAKIKDAVIASNVINDGFIKYDFLEDEPSFVIEGLGKGNAKYFAEFIDKKTLDYLKNGGIDLQNCDGKVETKVKIIVPLKQGTEIKYDISAKINDFALHLDSYFADISAYTLDAKYDGSSLSFKGEGRVNNLPSQTSMVINLYQPKDYWYNIVSKIYLQKENISNLPINIKDGSSVLNLNISLDKDLKQKITANANLDNLNFYLPPLALNKKDGRKAKFAFYNQQQATGYNNFFVEMIGEDNLKINGVIKNEVDNQKIELDNVKYLNNDFVLKASIRNKAISVDLSGKKVDLSDFNYQEYFKDNSSALSIFKVKANVDEIKMKNNISYLGVLADFECSTKACKIAKFNSSIDNKDFFLRLKLQEDYNVWALETNNTGKLLASLNLSNKIKGGTLKLIMSSPIYLNHNIEHLSHGSFEIYNIDSANNDFLTKIISFISVPGLIGALTNKDVHFDKVNSLVLLQANVINLQEMRARGPFFNFSTKGTIDLNKRKVHLVGNVAPSLYGVNYLVSRLPIIGQVLGDKRSIVSTPFFYNYKF